MKSVARREKEQGGKSASARVTGERKKKKSQHESVLSKAVRHEEIEGQRAGCGEARPSDQKHREPP